MEKLGKGPVPLTCEGRENPVVGARVHAPPHDLDANGLWAPSSDIEAAQYRRFMALHVDGKQTDRPISVVFFEDVVQGPDLYAADTFLSYPMRRRSFVTA